jgi:hypothetical protein
MHLRDRAHKHERQAEAKHLAEDFCFHDICFPFLFWSSLTWFFTQVLQEIPCEVTRNVVSKLRTADRADVTDGERQFKQK